MKNLHIEVLPFTWESIGPINNVGAIPMRTPVLLI